MNLFSDSFILICFIIVFLFFLFVSFSSTIIINSYGNIIFYCLLIFCFTSFFIIFLIYRSKYKVEIILILFSISFTLYSLEIFLLLKNYINKDSREITEIIDDIKNNNNNEFVSLAIHGQPLYRKKSNNYYRLGGLANSVTILCNEEGKWISYKSDKYGFRNNNELYNEKIDLIALGDSYLHGYCVETEDTFISNIQQKIYNSLNFGWAGMGPLKEYAVFKEYVVNFRPKIVLWFFYEGNDFENLSIEKKDKFLMKYINDENFNQKLISNNEDLQKLIKEHYLKDLNKKLDRTKDENKKYQIFDLRNTIIFKILTFDQIRSKFDIFLYPQNNDLDHDLDLFEKIISLTNKTVSSWGGKLYFVYLSDKKNYSFFSNANKSRYKVLNIIKSNKIDLIDTHKIMKSHPNIDSLFAIHYSKEGYQYLSKYILDNIELSK